MNINKKIEIIRKQPDHVRMRWVWFCVASSMAIILILWIFSITSLFVKKENSLNQTTNVNIDNIEQQLRGLREQASSIKDMGSEMLDSVDTESAEKATDGTPYPTTEAAPNETAQSNVYSDLSKRISE